MERTDAVLLRRRWMYNIAHIVITFILMDNVLCENKADIKELQSQICTKSIHDIMYDLRFKLQIKEKNIREKFQDLGEYTINGIVEIKQDIEKVYRAINPKYEYHIETDKHKDEVITCNGEKVQLQNKINEMYDEIKTIKELYMNKSDYKNITSFIKRLEKKLEKLEKQREIKLDNVNLEDKAEKWMKNLSENMERMAQKVEELSLKLNDYNDNTNYILGKHEMLLTNITENVNIFSETSSNNNRKMITDISNNTRIMKYVYERNMSEENVCMKMTECRKTVEEINALTDYKKLSEVIRNIYRNERKYDFSLILAIADSVTNLNSQLIIYETVFNELSHNLDLKKLIKICDAVKRYVEILIEDSNVEETLESAEELLESMLFVLKSATIKDMAEYLKNYTASYSNSTHIGRLNTSCIINVYLEEIYSFDKEFYEKLFESLVYEIYEMNRNVSNEQYIVMMSLLIYIRYHENLDIRVVGLMAFYKGIQNEDGWNDRHLQYNVLNCIKEILDMKIENDETVRAKNRIETTLVPLLPPCFRALVSFDHFCIRNLAQKGYISAVMYYEKQIVDNGTQPKFSTFSSTDEIPFGGEWTIQYKEAKGFHIHNYVLNKYLCVSKYGYDNYRYVYGCVKADDSIPFLWFIIPKDNYCYIHNIHIEYMFPYSDPNTNTGKSQNLLSLVTRGGSLNDIDPSFFVWQIVGCPAPTANTKQTQ